MIAITNGTFRTKTGFSLLLLPGLLLSMAAVPCLAQASPRQETGVDRWEESIREFERQDESSGQVRAGLLFMGSSSIRRWELDRHFAGFAALNRGFGGSQISDSVYYFDRILGSQQPKAIVLYAGDNDINAGKSAEVVFRDFRAFAGLVRERFPRTRLIFICIKPSLSRWHLVDEMRRANRLIQDFAGTQGWIDYIDIDTPMIGTDGKPRPELFVEDGLHLSEAGYQLWTSLVLPALPSDSVE